MSFNSQTTPPQHFPVDMTILIEEINRLETQLSTVNKENTRLRKKIANLCKNGINKGVNSSEVLVKNLKAEKVKVAKNAEREAKKAAKAAEKKLKAENVKVAKNAECEAKKAAKPCIKKSKNQKIKKKSEKKSTPSIIEFFV